jgi:hypothetical protein
MILRDRNRKRRPSTGHTRLKRRFLWVPAWCSDRTLRWLEKVECWQSYGGGRWNTLRRIPLPYRARSKR